MQSHRKLVKDYRILYKQKLESKKPSVITLNRLSDLENILDVMNIILTRQRVENEVRLLPSIFINLVNIIVIKICIQTFYVFCLYFIVINLLLKISFDCNFYFKVLKVYRKINTKFFDKYF